jgi:hypothetical protein
MGNHVYIYDGIGPMVSSIESALGIVLRTAYNWDFRSDLPLAIVHDHDWIQTPEPLII